MCKVGIFAKTDRLQQNLSNILGMGARDPVTAQKVVESGLIGVLMFSLDPAYDLVLKEQDMIEVFDEVFAGKRQNYSTLTPENAHAALYCACEAHCPFNVPVRERMMRAADIFGKRFRDV